MTDPYNVGGPQSEQRPQMFVGKQLPGGWMVGGNVPADNILGPIFLVIIAPFVAGHWVVDRYGWGGLIALLLGLAALAWFLTCTPIGRVIAMALLMFVGGFMLVYIGGGLLVILWAIAGSLYHAT